MAVVTATAPSSLVACQNSGANKDFTHFVLTHDRFKDEQIPATLVYKNETDIYYGKLLKISLISILS